MRRRRLKGRIVLGAAGTAAVAMTSAVLMLPSQAVTADAAPPPKNPIEHLVVIFQENVSFDHYFGTYPVAANPAGEPAFTAAVDTPTVNGLSGPLLTNNPNESNPQRLDRSQAVTCDQNHDYTAEQSAFDHGLMDMFVQNTSAQKNSTPETVKQCTGKDTGTSPNYAVMDYYDGNTVTGLWNYAQNFSMSDNSYSTNFGPSTSGAVNVTGANTYGTICGPSSAVYNAPPCSGSGSVTPPAASASAGPQPAGPGTIYSDADPFYDKCSGGSTIAQGGSNIGDLLNQADISWGWFQGGFASPDYTPGQPSTDGPATMCKGTHTNIAGATVTDYSPHHEPFQYYPSTANPQHTPPASIAEIGYNGPANHQYDLKDFFAAADAGNLPAVSYVKAAKYQDGHAGYSDPLDEQTFVATTVNHLEKLPSWKSTAVVIAYDDSDGWYDHQMSPITMQSQTGLDTLTDPNQCGANAARVPGTDSSDPSTPVGTAEQARCGYGPRQPLLLISPFSKVNFVDDTLTDQSSIVRFIEDNWLGGQRIGNGSADAFAGSLDNMFDFSHPHAKPLYLDATTGEPTDKGHAQT